MDKLFNELDEKETSGEPSLYFFRDEHTAAVANTVPVGKFILFMADGLKAYPAEEVVEILKKDLEDQSVDQILKAVSEHTGAVMERDLFKDESSLEEYLPKIDFTQADIWTLPRLKEVLLL